MAPPPVGGRDARECPERGWPSIGDVALQEWITWPEAAELVGCPVPTIDWYTRSGRILTRPHRGSRPTVNRASVQEFAVWWADRQQQRGRRRARSKGRKRATSPPAPRGWLPSEEAAQILGLSQTHALRLAHEGAYVTVKRGKRFWMLEADVRAVAAERARWVSLVDASRIAGCAAQTLTKAVRDGLIEQRATTNRAVPSLDRASVEEFAAGRYAERSARERADRQRRRVQQLWATPPQDGHVWLDTTTAALVLGLSRSRVYQLATEDRLPSTLRAGRRWFRRDHVEQRAAILALTRPTKSPSVGENSEAS